MSLPPLTVLRLGNALLHRSTVQPPVAARGAALLGRQALEEAVEGLWADRLDEDRRPTARSQLLCLAVVDPAAARRASHLWWALTRACHQHAYELTPTIDEIRELLHDARHVIETLQDTRTP